MWKRLSPGLYLALAGCTLLLRRDVEQCESHADCQALGPGYVCASDRVCVPVTSDELPAAAADVACSSDADCAGSYALSLCRAGSCQPLNAEAEGCISRDWGTTAPPDGTRALPIGLLASRTTLTRANPERGPLGAAITAIRELNRARAAGNGGALPALVAVACDEAEPASIAYLSQTLGVRLIIGPLDSENVVPVASQLGGEALLIAPFADGADLPTADLATSSIVSCKANRAGVRPYFTSAIREVRALLAAAAALPGESMVPVLAVGNDVATTAFAAGFSASDLDAAGLRAIPYIQQPGGRGLVSALGALEPLPNLVIAASAADRWADNIAAFDGASYRASQRYPYYFLADKRGVTRRQLLQDQATADGFPRQYSRVLGLDAHEGPLSALTRDEFEVAFEIETQSASEPGFEYVYDCTYLSVYAAVAGALRASSAVFDVSPDTTLAALSALVAAGPAIPVGALGIDDVVEALANGGGADGSVNLIGASGDLELEPSAAPIAPGATAPKAYYAPRAPDGELYCIDANTKEYCDLGIVLPAAGGPALREASSCSCFEGAP